MGLDEDIEFDAADAAPPEGGDDSERLTIDIDGWEGPLDLLLTLARTQKVDLRQISILQLVEQYLGFIENARALKLELAADYLVMAAWLAYLKSALLLPKDPEIDPSPEELALRLQLRLERLNAMRESGARLMARDRIGRDIFLRGAPEGLRVVRTTAWDCNFFELLSAYGQIQARNAPVMHVVKRRAVMTLEEALDRVSAMLGHALDWTQLEAFLPPDAEPALRRSALASSFLAMLELAKQGRVELQQASSFAPLLVKRSAGAAI
ncbi:ScpA family protein [Sphingorhabdus sp.]|jgi:segregation and condensation protein A|uniref:segregation and condensation protein A n=1 Tax=Sphingorhabdus sp. TaxID=1902408 RepID=UPI0035AE86BD|nr:segregation/condensation protein A [Sphingomonadaceae bacterium]